MVWPELTQDPAVGRRVAVQSLGWWQIRFFGAACDHMNAAAEGARKQYFTSWPGVTVSKLVIFYFELGIDQILRNQVVATI